MPEVTKVPDESPTRRQVRELTSAGVKPRDIAIILGLSVQRVYQQLAAIRGNGKKASA